MAVGAVTHSERWEISIGKGGVSIILPRVSCNRFVGTEDRCKQTFVEVFEATQRKADYTSSIKDTLCSRYRITYKKKYPGITLPRRLTKILKHFVVPEPSWRPPDHLILLSEQQVVVLG